jgi:hypothetical protein
MMASMWLIVDKKSRHHDKRITFLRSNIHEALSICSQKLVRSDQSAKSSMNVARLW